MAAFWLTPCSRLWALRITAQGHKKPGAASLSWPALAMDNDGRARCAANGIKPQPKQRKIVTDRIQRIEPPAGLAEFEHCLPVILFPTKHAKFPGRSFHMHVERHEQAGRVKGSPDAKIHACIIPSYHPSQKHQQALAARSGCGR